MTAVLVGLVFIAGGLWGIARWFPDFMATLRGIGPVSILIGGVVAVIAGLSSFRGGRVDEPKS